MKTWGGDPLECPCCKATLLGSFNVTSADGAGSVVIAASGSALVDFLNADTNGHGTFIITGTGWSSGRGSATPTMSSSNRAFHSKENLEGNGAFRRAAPRESDPGGHQSHQISLK